MVPADVHFTRLQALGSSDRFSAVATEYLGYIDSWRVYAYAICGQQPSGLVYVSSHTTSDSSGYKAESVSCPAGTKLISVGARTYGGDGQVIIDDAMPSATLTSQTVTSYEDTNGYGGDWSLWAYGVCSNPLAGLEMRTATTYGSGSTTLVFADASCPAGKRVHGLGGSISGGLGEVVYKGLYPSSSLDHSTAYAAGLPDTPDGNWYARAFAICAYSPPAMRASNTGARMGQRSTQNRFGADCAGGVRRQPHADLHDPRLPGQTRAGP